MHARGASAPQPMSATWPMSPPGTLPAAALWVQGVLLGTVGTSVAALGIAYLGFAMLAGRVDWRQGLRVVLGCFILFGAPAIVSELTALVRGSEVAATSNAASADFAPPPSLPHADPYAGASVPMDETPRE